MYLWWKPCACYTPSISNLFRNIEQRSPFKMIPNMNGFVNRLLRYWTVLSTFQMPLVFHITCREFLYFHILKIRIFFVVQDFWQSVYIKDYQTLFQAWKRRSYTYCHLSRSTTKPTKWPVRPAKTQISTRTVCSEPSPSAWRIFVFLTIPGAQSKKISNDQELIQSDPISCPQNQKGNN